jgi:hypothetical protein
MLAARFELKRFKIKGKGVDIIILIVSLILTGTVFLADQGYLR